jgi:laminin alpha 3/5
MANSPRPGVWALERSTDNGETYKPWQYFASNQNECFQFFKTIANQPIKRDDDVVCSTLYSKVLPLEGGEVSFFLNLLKFFSKKYLFLILNIT